MARVAKIKDSQLTRDAVLEFIQANANLEGIKTTPAAIRKGLQERGRVVSQTRINTVLSKLQKQGEVEKVGVGAGSHWVPGQTVKA